MVSIRVKGRPQGGGGLIQFFTVISVDKSCNIETLDGLLTPCCLSLSTYSKDNDGLMVTISRKGKKELELCAEFIGYPFCTMVCGE